MDYIKGYIGHKEGSSSSFQHPQCLETYMLKYLSEYEESSYKEIINFMSLGVTFNIFNRFKVKVKITFLMIIVIITSSDIIAS